MMMALIILGAASSLGRLEPHGPVDSTPRCVVEGGLGPPVTRPPIVVRLPPSRARRANPSNR